jgi:hypothetical protein
VIRQGLQSFAPALFGGSFAEGGDFIADRPQFIQVGERGAERVRVDPLTGPNASSGGGGGGETINLSLTVNGSLGGFTKAGLKALVKSAYIEAATRGNSIRRINARDARRSL